MSQTPEITLTGNSQKVLLEQLQTISQWDNGHDYPIKVFLDKSDTFIMAYIGEVEQAVKGDLPAYIQKEFGKEARVDLKGECYTGTPPSSGAKKKAKREKARNKMLHMIPPKKKRLKKKKTHRK